MIGPQLVGFLIFMVAGFAETNRAPFDLAEADAELVGGSTRSTAAGASPRSSPRSTSTSSWSPR